MLFQGVFDGLEYIGSSIKCAKSSVDLALSDIKCKRLLKDFEKREARKGKEIGEMEYDFHDNLESAFDIDITFNDLDEDNMIEYTDDWNEQFRWLSMFMIKVMEQNKSEEGFKPDDFKKEDIQKWINYLADTDVQKNAHAFDVNHQTNMFHWVVQECSNILYDKYPGYEDMFLDKEEAIKEFNISLLAKQMETGKKAGEQAHLMVKLPDDKVQINMPNPFETQGSVPPTGNPVVTN